MNFKLFVEDQYIEHSHTYTDKSGTYDVLKLIKAVKNRQTEKIDISSLIGMSYSKKDGFSPKTKLPFVDVSYPILIDNDNKIIDGRHRVAKLIKEKISHVQAIRITSKDLDAVKTKATPEHSGVAFEQYLIPDSPQISSSVSPNI